MGDSPVYDTFPGLATPHLTLRELQAGDAAAILEIGADDAIMRWYDLDTFTDVADAAAFIDRQRLRFAQRHGIRWGLALRESGQVVGWCGFVQGPYQRVELGYALARACWRQGLMREALPAIIQFSLAAMDVNRVEAVVHVENAASRGLLEQLGFRAEGTLRDYGFWRGQFHTLVMYALLRSDRQPGSGL
jgi:ribosomal-protein-alanine N-acetyltransferase